MFPLQRAGLQARIVVLSVLSTLVMLAVFGISSVLAVNESIDRTLRERLVLAQTTAELTDHVLKQNLQHLQDVALSPDLNLEDPDMEAERRALRDAYFHSIFSDGVYLVDRAGTIRWMEPFMPDPSRRDLSAYPHVRQALESGRPIVSNVYTATPARRPVVSLLYPIQNERREVIGLVGGDIDVTSPNLAGLIQPVRLGRTGYSQIVDGNGIVVASGRAQDILTESDHGNYLAALIKNKQTSMGTCHGCHESARSTERQTEVMAFTPLSTASWGIAIRQSEEEALAPTEQLRRQFLFFSAAMLLLSLLLAWAIAQSVVRPVRMLTGAAERIAAGRLDEPIGQAGQDEIGMLAATFDEMRLRLKESLEKVQEWNRQLESSVQMRTRELKEYQEQLLRRNEELMVLYRELERKEALRGELLRKVISAQEEERKRIARELHDETSQALAALALALETASVAPTRSIKEMKARIAAIKPRAVGILEEVRKLTLDLRPTVLDDLGLIPAIRWYAENRLRHQGVKVQIEAVGNERRLPPELETTLFRVVQEAISNVGHHARAENVIVTLDFSQSSVVIEVEDDGEGFDLASVSKSYEKGRGLGLMGMRERVALFSGTLEIETAPGAGTQLRIEVPIEGARNGKD